MTKKAKKRNPKAILKLPDLEQSKNAVLNSLSSMSSRRSYDHAIRDFIDWYCSEPRLSFNRTVVTRYESLWNSAGMPRRGSISGLPQFAGWQTKHLTAASSVLTWPRAFGG